MNKLQKQLAELESKISRQELINPSISQASIGWHIEHTLLTIDIITERLRNTDPANYKWKFNLSRLIVSAMNKIPRGRAKAPGIVKPQIYNSATLKDHLQKTKENVKELELINPEQYFEHPYFGHLRLKKAVKFLAIHTGHHIKIINDIIKIEEGRLKTV